MVKKKKNKYKLKPWEPDYGAVDENYVWWQTKEEIWITVTVPQEVKARNFIVEIHAATVSVKLRDGGEEKVFMNGKMFDTIDVDASTWTKEGDELEITLTKNIEKWWGCVIRGDSEVSIKNIEGSQYVDDNTQRKIYEEKRKKKIERLKRAGIENPQIDSDEED